VLNPLGVLPEAFLTPLVTIGPHRDALLGFSDPRVDQLVNCITTRS
jgi:hypothetical protein